MENQISNTNTIQSNTNRCYSTQSTTGNGILNINNGFSNIGISPIVSNSPSVITTSPMSVDWGSPSLLRKNSDRIKELEELVGLLLNTINEEIEDINKEVDSIINMIRKKPDNTNIYNNLLQSLLGRRDSFLKIKSIINNNYEKKEETEEK